MKEYQALKNKNVVQDKRGFKKKNPNSKFIQSLEKKKKKKNMFNLDSDEEEIKLTHNGRE